MRERGGGSRQILRGGGSSIYTKVNTMLTSTTIKDLLFDLGTTPHAVCKPYYTLSSPALERGLIFLSEKFPGTGVYLHRCDMPPALGHHQSSLNFGSIGMKPTNLNFMWGLVQFMMSVSQGEPADAGKQHMLWGVIGLVIMFSVAGIINVITNSIGGTHSNPIEITGGFE